MTPSPDPDLPRLTASELHVWRVPLDAPSASIEGLSTLLAADEQHRASRLVRKIDQHRFIISHAVQRAILGHYLSIPPECVALSAQPGKKPECGQSAGLPALRHNLSHSCGLALLGLALGREVGIDVEYVRPMNDLKNIVDRYFAPGERAAWHGLPDAQQLAAFFRCWTRKEAYLKAQGIGLSAALDRFEVSFADDDRPRLVKDDDRPDATMHWELFDISPSPDCPAACVVERGIEEIRFFEWPGDLSPSYAFGAAGP
jgi:4'-phosphopantetheinyl transferase